MTALTTLDEGGVEAAIVERIGAVISASPALPHSVRAHPGDLPNFALGAAAEFFVKYSGSGFDLPTPSPHGGATQLRRPRVTVFLRYRNAGVRDAHAGAADYLRRARLGLTAWTLPGVAEASCLYPVSEDLREEAAGIWLYEQVYSFSVLEAFALPAPEEEEEP